MVGTAVELLGGPVTDESADAIYPSTYPGAIFRRSENGRDTQRANGSQPEQVFDGQRLMTAAEFFADSGSVDTLLDAVGGMQTPIENILPWLNVGIDHRDLDLSSLFRYTFPGSKTEIVRIVQSRKRIGEPLREPRIFLFSSAIPTAGIAPQQYDISDTDVLRYNDRTYTFVYPLVSDDTTIATASYVELNPDRVGFHSIGFKGERNVRAGKDRLIFTTAKNLERENYVAIKR